MRRLGLTIAFVASSVLWLALIAGIVIAAKAGIGLLSLVLWIILGAVVVLIALDALGGDVPADDDELRRF